MKAGIWIVLFPLLLVACATSESAARRETPIRTMAVEAFGGDANLRIHEVMWAGPLSGSLSSLSTGDQLALEEALASGAIRPLDLAIWSNSSSKLASTLKEALRYPNVQKLPQWRLLFVGNAADAEKVRPAVEATGAKFFTRPGIGYR